MGELLEVRAAMAASFSEGVEVDGAESGDMVYHCCKCSAAAVDSMPKYGYLNAEEEGRGAAPVVMPTRSFSQLAVSTAGLALECIALSLGVGPRRGMGPRRLLLSPGLPSPLPPSVLPSVLRLSEKVLTPDPMELPTLSGGGATGSWRGGGGTPGEVRPGNER